MFDLDLTHLSLLAFNTKQAGNKVPFHEGIKQTIRHSPFMNADETGWQVDGDNHWLWVFISKNVSLYHIDESYGGKVVSALVKSIRGFGL